MTTHDGIETRALMRAMSARSPMSATVSVGTGVPRGATRDVVSGFSRTTNGAKNKKPRFAVWGGRMNLRKQVEPLLSVALQASSKQRHAQRATSRLTLD